MAALALPLAAADAVSNGDFAEGTDGWDTSKQHPFDIQIISVGDPEVGIDQALQLTVATKPAKPWDVQLRQRLDGSISNGQPIKFKVWLRSETRVDVALSLQMTSAPFAPILFKRVTLEPQWKQFDLSGKANAGADGVQVVLTAGFASGSMQMTGVEVEFGQVTDKPTTIEELPIVDASSFLTPGIAETLPAQARSIVGPLERLKVYNPAGTAEITDNQTLRVTTHQPTEWTYKVQAINPSLAPIRRGDTLMALVRWRMSQPNDLLGYASLGVLVQQTGPPHTSELSRLVTASTQDWQELVLPFYASQDYSAGDAALILRVGYGPQAIEVSDAVLVNFGGGVELASLPHSRQTYGGAEPDAPWRAAANERIEKYRTGQLEIRVMDRDGEPVPNAQVNVELIRHAFGFGSALSAHRFPGGRGASDAGPYLERAAELFNWGVMENAMKWPLAEDKYFQDQLETALAWMQEHDLTIRGHTLIWPSFSRAPKSLESFADQPDRLRSMIETRIQQTARRYAGVIDAWDVINEPYKKRDILDLVGGDPTMEHWMRLAREADPSAELFINDFQILSDPSAQPVRARYYLELIDKFKTNGVPIDGMGMQGHFSGELTPIDQVIARIDEFAQRGIKIHITEFDIATDDEQLQADYTRDFLTACYSHPAVEAVLFWGFWEGQMFQKIGALFRKDWSIKPAGEAFKQRVHRDWKTKETLMTDSDGHAAVRGYVGTYLVRVKVGSQIIEESVELTPAGLEIQLSPGGEPR